MDNFILRQFRILRLREAGLLSEWEKWYIPLPSKCMELNKRIDKPQLSLKHLSSAFVILIVGCVLSTIVFILEMMPIFSCLFRAN